MSKAFCRKLMNLDIHGRNRKWGVAYYVRNSLSCIKKNFFPEEIGNIFFEIPLPKPDNYLQPKQFPTNSEWKIRQTWYSQKELYILGDFNINFYQNRNNAEGKKKTPVLETASNDVKMKITRIKTTLN